MNMSTDYRLAPEPAEITLVAGCDIPGYGDCSRDPDVLAAGLRALGQRVTGPLRVGGGRRSGNPYGLDWPAGPRLESARAVVVSIGSAAPVASAVLAQTRAVPLVIVLPADLLLPTTDLPSGYGQLLCGHLAAACLIVESERQRAAAEKLGAAPHSVFVVSPGLDLPDLKRPSTRPPAPAPLRILYDTWAASPAEQEFVAEVVAQLQIRCGEALDVVLVAEAAASIEAHRNSDVVVIPDSGSYATIVALRAMAAGRPLLAAGCPAIQDVVTTARHGVIARPGATVEWIDKLHYLLTGAALRAHLGRSARVKAETDFALQTTLQEFDKRLRAVASSWNYLSTSRDDL